jgi:hypothetical protein
MRKLIAMAAAAALVAGLTACGSTAPAEENSIGTGKVVAYRVTGKVITRLRDGSTAPNGMDQIGTIAWTGPMGLPLRATDVTFPYATSPAAPIVLEPGTTATISVATPVNGWVECTISVDGKVVVTQRSPEARTPTVTCSTTV